MPIDLYDLYDLEDDVLHLNNDAFYSFVIQTAGELEAEILKIQGIRNAWALLRSADPLDVFKFDCDELNELKNRAFWHCTDGQFIVKQGIELNLQILMDVLKEIHQKYIKKIQKKKKTSSLVPVPLSSSSSVLHIIDNQQASNNTSHSHIGFSQCSLLSTDATAGIDRIPSLVKNYTSCIVSLIDRYSKKIFESTVLEHNEHYHLSFMHNDQKLKATVTCQCGRNISILLREETLPSSPSFIMSNYYAHLSNSDCSMMRKLMTKDRQSVDSIQSQSYSTKAIESTPLSFDKTSDSSSPTNVDDDSSVESLVNDNRVMYGSKRKLMKRHSTLTGRPTMRKKARREIHS